MTYMLEYDFVEDRLERAELNLKIPNLEETLEPNYWGRKAYNRLNEALTHVEEEATEETYEKFEEEVSNFNYEDALSVLE